MGLIFDRDGKKAESNKRKHGVTFGEATTVFGANLMVRRADTREPHHEERFFTVGECKQGRLLAISHTEIGDLIRIISARQATAHERNEYEDGR